MILNLTLHTVRNSVASVSENGIIRWFDRDVSLATVSLLGLKLEESVLYSVCGDLPGGRSPASYLTMYQ